MIITEQLDGMVRHYSDKGEIVQVQTGKVYSDAIDRTPCAYTYKEAT